MPWANRTRRPIPTVASQQAAYDMNDYSDGMDSYTSNDKFPVMTGQTRRLMGPNKWRLAQDARITTIGEYDTRKGFDFYSQAAGETQDQGISSTTGAADISFSTTTRLAQKFTTTAGGQLTRLDINMKNPSSNATGVVLVNLYSDAAGAPGTLIASTSTNSINITSSNSYVTFLFASAPLLQVSTSYWIVLYVQPTGTNSYTWASTTAFSSAKLSTDSGATWVAQNYALNFKQYYSTLTGVLGLVRVYKNDGTKYTFFAVGTTLYSINEATGALNTIKTGLNAAATHYRFAFANDILWYVNGYDGYRKYDFTTESQVNATNYNLICWHKGLMFLGGGPDPNAVVFSNFGLYDTFTSTDFIYAGAPKTGDPPVSFNSLNGYLLIRCKNNNFILSGDNNATFSIDEAPDQKGTYSQETVCQDEQFVYFLTDDGLRRSNGSESKLISTAAYEEVKNISNKAGACVAISKGRLYLWYASATSGSNDSCFVWNVNFNYCLESKDTGAYVQRAFTAYGDNDQLIVGSSVVGQVHWQELATNEYNNLGEALQWELRGPYFTNYNPAVLKEFRYWEPRFAAQSGNYSIDCQYAYDLRENWQTLSSQNVQGVGPVWGSGITWGSFTWGTTVSVQSQLSIPGEYQRLAVRYKHTGTRQPCKFYGHSFVLQSRRMR
jgi:hypothetical protein